MMSDKAIGGRVRAIRVQKEAIKDRNGIAGKSGRWTQLQLINEMDRLEGIKWTVPTLSAIEAGTRSLRATELEALLAVFRIDFDTFLGRDSHRKHAIITPEPIVMRARFPSLGSQHLSYEADSRAARRLGIKVQEVQQRSQKLWGCSLAKQREKVARKRPGWNELEDSAKQRVRGHVTRQLVKELKEA